MYNSTLFEQFIETYYLVTCKNIENKQITFAVPFNKFSCDKINDGDLIFIVEANAWSLKGEKLHIVKIQKSMGCRNYIIVKDYKRISYSEFIPQINASASASALASNSTYSAPLNSEYTTDFRSTDSSFEFNEYKDKVNSILNRLNNESTNTTTEKEFNNMKKIFGTYFGKFDTASIAMSIYGMAVKDATGRHVTIRMAKSWMFPSSSSPI